VPKATPATKGTKQIAGEVADSAGAAIEWVAGWF